MSPFVIPKSLDVFFWMYFFGMLIFQGAVHTCILVALKSIKYKNLGNRWESVVWINFFWVAVFLWVSSWIYEWGHQSLFDGVWLSVSLLIHLGLSGWCLVRSARWAAYES